MTDLFSEKARDWDKNDIPRQISAAVGATLLEQVPLNKEMRVMDFGAGTGLISSQVAPRVESILAVDISRAMLDRLMAKPELQGKVSLCCQDIIATPLNKKFDLIMSAMALHHVEDTDALLRRFAEHLHPGAKLALADLDKEDGDFHPPDTQGVYHAGFERQALQDSLERNGFTDVQFYTAHTVVKEGRDYPIFLLTANKT